MGTSWVGLSIKNIKTRASREMTSRKISNFSNFMGWTLPSTDMRRGEVFAISDCLVDVWTYNMYIAKTINVCTNFEINRYNIDEFRKYAKIVCFIWNHVTQKRYASYVIAAVTLLIGTFAINQRLMSSGSKVMTQSVFLLFLVTLTFDLYCTFYAWSTGISLRMFQ